MRPITGRINSSALESNTVKTLECFMVPFLPCDSNNANKLRMGWRRWGGDVRCEGNVV